MSIVFGHAGEEHSGTGDSLAHQISEEPIIGLLLACAVVCIVAAIIVVLLGKNQSLQKDQGKKLKDQTADEHHKS